MSSILKTYENFSACPNREPGTDIYRVFSSIQFIPSSDSNLKLVYKVSGSIIDIDGNRHWTFQSKNEDIEIDLKLFKTKKGLRIGNANTRLILQDGVFFNKSAAESYFKIKIN